MRYEKYFTFDRFAEGFVELLNEVTGQNSAKESVRNLARSS